MKQTHGFAFLLPVIFLLACNLQNENDKIKGNVTEKANSKIPDTTSPENPPATNEARSHFTIDLNKLKLMNALPPAVVVTVDDPVYKKPMQFEGYPLAAILENAIDLNATDTATTEIAFRCLDGYAPTMSLQKALSVKGVIAARDLNVKDNSGWEPVAQGKEMVSPAPFYLVWEGITTTEEGFPWPYQLSSIEIVSSENLYGSAFPEGNQTAEKGFWIFKDHCMSCHSINLVGGTLGPELNIPKNVTEYWQTDGLKSFIKDASSFHARSKMPSFPDLSEDDLEAIVFYLKFMSTRKSISK